MTQQLTHSPARVFLQVLADLGYVALPGGTGTGGWLGSVYLEMTSPDDTIFIAGTESELQGRLQPTGEMPEHFGIQIKVRSSIPQEGYCKANQLAVACDRVLSGSPTVVDGVNYRLGAVTRRGGVLNLGKEVGVTQRYLYTINVIVIVTQQ